MMLKKFTWSLLIGLLALGGEAGVINTINCPDCGSDVSVRAVFCPKCGCSKEAIVQHYRAVENASKLSDSEAKALLGSAYMGQMGRVRFFRERRQIESVLTNFTDSVKTYSPEAKKGAESASVKAKKILKMGFTLDQIFTMRMDLVDELLGRRRNMVIP